MTQIPWIVNYEYRSTRKFNLRKELLTKAHFNEARVCVVWTVHAICESNYSRSLISFRFPARCVLSRDKFSPIPQLLEAEGAGRSSSFFSHSRCGARVVPEGPCPRPSACVGVLYFLAAVAADAAHLHGAISYVLRRPITRVDSGSDRKPSRGPTEPDEPRGPCAAGLFPFR